MSNRLADESSPYLLQHAQNPVEWLPWGPEAFERARVENKPVFLSIGYSTCHWCHVMARESFTDKATADFMNEHFINIKVDREERPDLDSIYMRAVTAMTGRGGWPMSVWLTPEGVPFYGGSYFPKTPYGRMLSFRQIMEAIASAWAEDSSVIVDKGKKFLDSLDLSDQADSPETGELQDILSSGMLDRAVETLAGLFDRNNGGWGGAPKFPQPMVIEFLLRRYARTGDELSLEMAEFSLERMACGGVCDQLGAGFHRYSTDAQWLVPHFEKMLYDNAQLARAYLHAWQVTGNNFYRKIAVETLDYVVREMSRPGGGFYSAQDADSEGDEGKYYLWTGEEIKAVLRERAELFFEAYGATMEGNFEGRNILHIACSFEVLAKRRGVAVEQIESSLAEAKQKLTARRNSRVKPNRDEKILTAWNGLMLAAFAEAARVLDRADYLKTAVETAEFILAEQRTSGGRLLRSWTDAGGAGLNGYLEDYANLVEGLIELYQATFDSRWFSAARETADFMIARFGSPIGLFYDTSDDHETLITRPRTIQDNAAPSGNSMAAMALLKLGSYTGSSTYSAKAEKLLLAAQHLVERYPLAFGQWLSAFEFAVSDAKAIALVGDPEEADMKAIIEAVFSGFRPNQVVAMKRPGEPSFIPLLEDREDPASEGGAVAYVCRRFACLGATADPAELRRLLTEVSLKEPDPPE